MPDSEMKKEKKKQNRNWQHELGIIFEGKQSGVRWEMTRIRPFIYGFNLKTEKRPAIPSAQTRWPELLFINTNNQIQLVALKWFNCFPWHPSSLSHYCKAFVWHFHLQIIVKESNH